MSELIAYCVKCRAQRPLSQPQAIFMANGRPGTRGTCAVCGTGLFKIGATPAHAEMTPPAPAPQPKAVKTEESPEPPCSGDRPVTWSVARAMTSMSAT